MKDSGVRVCLTFSVDKRESHPVTKKCHGFNKYGQNQKHKRIHSLLTTTINLDQQGDASIPTGYLHASKFPTYLPRFLLIRRHVVGLRHPTGSSNKTS